MRAFPAFAFVFCLTVMFGVAPASALNPDEPRCGEYRLRLEMVNVGFDARDRYRVGVLHVLNPSGKVVKTIAYRDLGVLGPCRDLTADGVPELLVEGHTGGNPGFRVSAVYSMGDRVENLLVFGSRAGIDPTTDLRNLDGDPALEIVVSESGLSYIGDLPATAPVSLPMVLCHRGRRYVDCTNEFASLVQTEIVQTEHRLKALSEEAAGAESNEAKAAAVRLLGLHLLMNDAARGKARLEQVARPEIASRVLGMARRIAEAVGRRSSLVRYEQD